MEHAEGEQALLGSVEEADVAQRLERGRQKSRAHVDDGDLALAVLTLSNTFIWSAVEVRSTTSVMSGCNRRRVPLGNSVSKARVGMLCAIR